MEEKGKMNAIRAAIVKLIKPDESSDFCEEKEKQAEEWKKAPKRNHNGWLE